MSYKKLGLKCGIEIHQQLEGKKLFCDCPTVLREDKPDFVIKRRLRAVAGEHGEIDVAALYEQLKGKTFFYEGYKDATCLVETDCEPPHELNKDALYTALQFCRLVKAKVSSIIQVMRKTVVDGSNTSGFQRTALVGREGIIDTSEGKVRIENISLEEDACRIIKEEKDKTVFRLDRLGIPLIEIGTAPDIRSPQQCKEAAEKLGMLLRSLPGVKRGLGTIRQDVNISISEGARVEIKGVQELKQIPLIVEKEIERQLDLVNKGKKVKEEVRKVNLDGTTSFMRPMPGAERMYPETDVPLIWPDSKGIEVPETLEEKMKRYQKELGLSKDLAQFTARSDKVNLFEELTKKYPGIKAAFIAETLVSTPLEIKRNYNLDPEKLTDDNFKELFLHLAQEKIHKDIVLSVLIDMIKGKFSIRNYETLSTEELHTSLKEIINQNKGAPFGALMGIAMKKLAGKASGKIISEALKNLVSGTQKT